MYGLVNKLANRGFNSHVILRHDFSKFRSAFVSVVKKYKRSHSLTTRQAAMKTLNLGMFPVVKSKRARAHTHTHTHKQTYICNEVFAELERVLYEAADIWVLACGDREKLRKTSVRIVAFQAEK